MGGGSTGGAGGEDGGGGEGGDMGGIGGTEGGIGGCGGFGGAAGGGGEGGGDMNAPQKAMSQPGGSGSLYMKVVTAPASKLQAHVVTSTNS